jgi:putative aldouronate transport system permease protein
LWAWCSLFQQIILLSEAGRKVYFDDWQEEVTTMRTYGWGERITQYLIILFLTLLCVSMIYPFLHTISISFSTPAEALRNGIHLYPREWSLEAYRQAFSAATIWIGFGNTIFRTVVGTFLALVFMSLTAYGLSKRTLPHRTFYTWIFLFTMFFSGGLIPTYLLIKSLGLLDTRWVYILAPPFLINTFSMLIMRNFFMNISVELEESAKLDGANDFQILRSLIIPLSKPVLATVGLWSAVHHWNSWFDGLIYNQNPHNMVLQIFLRRLIVENVDQDLQQLMNQSMGTAEVLPETIKAATLMITIIPIILVYPFLQKYFVKGTMVGSLKG